MHVLYYQYVIQTLLIKIKSCLLLCSMQDLVFYFVLVINNLTVKIIFYDCSILIISIYIIIEQRSGEILNSTASLYFKLLC